MRVRLTLLAALVGAGSLVIALQAQDSGSLLSRLPKADPPVLTQDQATFLANMPIACLERPQAPPAGRGYLWEATYRPPDDYQKNLAFYGCFDWHSSVNSTWTLVRLLKAYPNLDGQIAGLARKILNEHLGTTNLAGELAYLKGAGQFERPYGYAWILKLSAELSDW